ncbi:MAG: sugar ABC transporter permease [Cohaesibacteraceae bacterium]|nr:sugar ABC transporter permease [Cohaesibacteraceae bacterium]PCH80249.1 MAG: ABC transporter permease [Hyphomicrobiales bacterium]
MKRNVVPYALIFPGLFFSGLIILWPLIQLGILSTSEVNRFGQVLGPGGFENYRTVLTDPEMYAALWRTVIWTTSIIGGTFIIAMPVSIILQRDFFGRDIARVIIMLPWAISLAMLAIIGRWALNGESGMLNSALLFAGIIDKNIPWLGQASTAFPMQITIGILATIPFTTTIFLGGLSSIPTDIYEAAKIEGANGWQQFYKITLPMMRPFINIAIVLNTIYVFNSFPIIWATTQGGPMNSTDILVTYLYKLAFRFGRVGDAAVLSLIMFAMLLIFAVVYVRLAMKGNENATG